MKQAESHPTHPSDGSAGTIASPKSSPGLEVVPQNELVSASSAETPKETVSPISSNQPYGHPHQGSESTIRFTEVVTGQFDADEANALVEEPKRILSAQAETPKLHKVLAQAGLGSRLEMEQLILEGRISVNAEPAHIGQRIQFGDQIKINGKPIRVRIDPPPARVIAYHKPSGEVVTHDDPQNRPTVFRRLPKLFHGKWQSVGRLDLNTEGLLLLTNAGELANRLMHPRFGLEREYAVRVLGALSNEEKKRLLEGVSLDDGVAQFSTLEAGGGEGANCWYKVTLSEGRNREVRRMFEAVGHAVSRLIRIRYGAVVLPRGLKRGAFVELDEQDIQALTNAAVRSERQGLEAEGGTSIDGVSGTQPRKTGTSGSRSSGDTSRFNAGSRGRGGASQARGPANLQAGFANPRQYSNARGDRSSGTSQPDPLKTSFGYIGAETLTRQRDGQGQGQNRGANGRRSGGSGNGNGGGNGNGNTNRGGGGNRSRNR